MAENINFCHTPLEYLEVEDIVEQNIEAKIYNFLYLFKSKNKNENIWILGPNFLHQVQYHKKKMNKNQK